MWAASAEIARNNPRPSPKVVAFVKWELAKAALFATGALDHDQS